MSEAITLVCKICGRDFVMPEGKLLWPCPGCSTAHSRPRAVAKALADLRRAHQQRSDCDFTNAAANYQRVLNVHPDEAEALWGLALCKYGVEFVRDERTGQHLPVIHFLNRRPFTEDPDCRLAIEKADDADRSGYQQNAGYIARIQQEVLSAEARGEEYDVFLCYKGSVPGAPNASTREYQHALQLYTALREEGYSVFFAHMTLRRAAGANYEAQIFHALQSARVMLVIASEPAYLTTPWVQSEWRRFLERIDAKEDCRLVPLLYDRCDPYNLPEAFQNRSIQGLAMDNVTALDDLRSILDECIPDDKPGPVRETVVVQQSAAPGIESLLRRVTLFLEDGDWKSADEYCEKVLDADPENARAYLGKLMAAMKVRHQEKLREVDRLFDGDPNYVKAVRFADAKLVRELKEASRLAAERHALAMKEAAYRKAAEAMAEAGSEEAYKAAGKLFEELGGYKDASAQAAKCIREAEIARKDALYEMAAARKRHATSVLEYEEAIQAFQNVVGWKDAEQQIAACRKRIEELRAKIAADQERSRRRKEAEEQAYQKWQRKKKAGKLLRVAAVVVPIVAVLLAVFVILPGNKYNEAVALMEAGEYWDAVYAFMDMNGYKDSAEMLDACFEKWYKDAMALKGRGAYEDAAAAFEELNECYDYVNGTTYKDCAVQVQECNYKLAEWYLSGGYKAQAAICFGKAGNYRDAHSRSWNLWSEVAVRDVLTANYTHTIGLRSNGTLVATGYNGYGQNDVSGWSDIIAVSTGDRHTVGLRANGTVVAVGRNSSGQCNVSEWKDIVAISAGENHTVGLRMDGTVVTTGSDDMSDWKDIVAISAGGAHTLGLRANGTVVGVGYNEYGQINTSSLMDIVAISAGTYHSLCLRADGTVVILGSSSGEKGQITGWNNIVAIAAEEQISVGLRADGTVVVAGGDEAARTVSDWRSIVAIEASENHVVGLRSDGIVVAAGSGYNGECEVSGWRLKQIPRPTLPR